MSSSSLCEKIYRVPLLFPDKLYLQITYSLHWIHFHRLLTKEAQELKMANEGDCKNGTTRGFYIQTVSSVKMVARSPSHSRERRKHVSQLDRATGLVWSLLELRFSIASHKDVRASVWHLTALKNSHGRNWGAREMVTLFWNITVSNVKNMLIDKTF